VVGVAALAGPVTTVAGKVLKGTKQVGEGLTSAAKFFAKVGGAANVAEEGISASAVAMGVAKTGGIALATIALAAIVTAAIDAKKREDELTEATSGLASAQSNAAAKANAQSTATDTATTSEADLAAAIKNASDETNAAIESQAKMASTIESNFESTDRTNAQLGSYRDTIDQLANKSGLTAQQQADLKTAVDGLNQSCGTAYSVIDAENGKIADQSGVVQDDTQAINDLISAKQLSNQMDALSSAYQDTYEQQATNAKNLTDATNNQKAAQDLYNEKMREAAGDTAKTIYYQKIYGSALNKANKTLSDAQSAYDADTGAMSSYNDQLNLLTQAQSAGVDSVAYAMSQNAEFIAQVEGSGKSVSSLASQMSDLGVTSEQMGAILADPTATEQLVANYDGSETSVATALASMGIDIDAAAASSKASIADMASSIQSLSDSGSVDLSAIGLSAGELSQALSDAGVSSQASAAISNGAFAGMLAQSGGDINSLISILQGYNSTPIVDKDGNVTVNETSLTDAQGNVYTWNGSQVIDKDGNAVVDDLSLTDAQGNLVTWNGSSLVPQSSSATVDDGSLSTAQGRLDNWDSSYLVDQNGSANVNDSSLQNAIYKRNDWNNGGLWDKTATAIINFVAGGGGGFGGGGGGGAFASGGIRTHADGGIRYHASGYIATKAQFLPRDVVGEAGAEAIVPLTNRKYVTPFANTIAEQMLSAMKQYGSKQASSAVDTKSLSKEIATEVRRGLSDMGIYIDGKKLTGAIAPKMDIELARIGSRR
jgi:hypothetical protein